ncbi:MAG: ROK family protein [Candidatus Phlomobacter fragariae]
MSIISEHHIFHSIGGRLDRRDCTLALYPLNGKVLAEAYSPLPETGQQEIENNLIAAIENFIQQHQHPNRELIAISVILPGLVNSQAGIVHYMPHIKIHNRQLLSNLKEHFKITCFIGHDIRSFAPGRTLFRCYTKLRRFNFFAHTSLHWGKCDYWW